jgi:hypothetical protein
MPAPAILDHDAALSTILEHITYTLTRLSAQPLTANLVAAIASLHKHWFQINTQEIYLQVDIQKAQAAVVAADDDLDLLVDRVASIVLIATGNDRSAPLYKLFFGDKRPSDIKRPILAGQLDTMRNWIIPLKGSSIAELAAIGGAVEQKVAIGDAAAQTLATVETANRVFRATGERRVFIGQVNAARKLLYGKLAELPHKHPEANLPGSFADRFFKRVSRVKDRVEPPTSEELRTEVAETETRLTSLRDRLKDALAREETEAQEEKARLAKNDELAKLKADRDALDAKIAALEAKQPG